jgi:hypothetical protein
LEVEVEVASCRLQEKLFVYHALKRRIRVVAFAIVKHCRLAGFAPSDGRLLVF